MTDDVNQRILKRIEKDVEDPRVRAFLKTIVVLEFKHLDEEKWRYLAEYEKLISMNCLKERKQ
jgi:hypothetical protein